MQSFEDASKHQREYNKMTDREKSESFFLLMQTNFGFVNQPWPKMDKTYFRIRSHEGK